MFSVDNFYTIFNSHYGWPEKNNRLSLFIPHGSKNFGDCVNWGDAVTPQTAQHEVLQQGVFIMHDQEPFEVKNIQNYITKMEDIKFVEALTNKHPDREFQYLEHHRLFQVLTPEVVIHLSNRTLKFPIICHSEKNSQDVKWLEKNNIVTCYYWWHGMVARDWFRHYERHNSLNVVNKADSKYRFLIYSRDSTGTRQYRKNVINSLRPYKDLINYNWDNEPRDPTLSASIDITDATNSAIHIVAETLFDTEKIYLTEKVFKPMVMSQPFILLAPPKSLQYLRDYGFKTFNNVWNEDYDLVVDSKTRKKLVLNLVNDLLLMSAQQFRNLYKELLPIIDYNRRRFFSKEFQELLWEELERNCSESLAKQQGLTEQIYGGSWIYYLNQLLSIPNIKLDSRWSDILNDLLCRNILEKSKLDINYPNLSKII